MPRTPNTNAEDPKILRFYAVKSTGMPPRRTPFPLQRQLTGNGTDYQRDGRNFSSSSSSGSTVANPDNSDDTSISSGIASRESPVVVNFSPGQSSIGSSPASSAYSTSFFTPRNSGFTENVTVANNIINLDLEAPGSSSIPNKGRNTDHSVDRADNTRPGSESSSERSAVLTSKTVGKKLRAEISVGKSVRERYVKVKLTLLLLCWLIPMVHNYYLGIYGILHCRLSIGLLVEINVKSSNYIIPSSLICKRSLSLHFLVVCGNV